MTFLGYLPEDIPRLYRIADLFIIASVAELQSIVTMEAMASGLPVIAADAMALPELPSGRCFPGTPVRIDLRSSIRMDLAMTFPTKSDEVFFNIIAQLAARCNVVNF